MNILNDISDEFEMEFEIANKIIYKRKLLVQYITKNFYKEKTFA